MTNKEAYYKFMTYIGTHKDSELKEAFNVIEQALERLEELEKENQKLKKENIIKYEYLIEAQKIKINELEKENEKRKRAIEILAKHIIIHKDIDDETNDTIYYFEEIYNENLNEKKYKLLKEVVWNEQ